MIGQLILIGLEERTAFTANDPLALSLQQGWAGGVIFYQKNLAPANTGQQLRQWIYQMQQLAPVPLFVSIDEEGGRVHRLKPEYGFFDVPSAFALGQVNQPDSTYKVSYQLAQTLASLGFNVNFAPSTDLLLNPENPVIAKLNRSFGANPQQVAAHAGAFIRAQRAFGIITTLKHFPGHGSSTTDTHHNLTDVSQVWEPQELAPYQILIQQQLVDGVMTGHLVNSQLDPSLLPATLSAEVLQKKLRNELRYDGLVFTDDMHMNAISGFYGLEKSIELALNAGVDVLLFSNNVVPDERHTPQKLAGIIRELVVSGRVPIQRIQQSYNRIMHKKAGFYVNQRQ